MSEISVLIWPLLKEKQNKMTLQHEKFEVLPAKNIAVLDDGTCQLGSYVIVFIH